MKSNVNKTGFTNFPPDLNPKYNIFLEALYEIKKVSNIKKKIHFYGCYPKIRFYKRVMAYLYSKFSNKGMVKWLNNQYGIEKPESSKDFNIWVTFENRRPPHKDFDLTISFDVDSYEENNLYLPLIYQYMNITGKPNNYSKHKISPHQAMMPRIAPPEVINLKNKFLVSFINNPHPTRLRAQELLSEIESISTFGRSVNNYAKDKIKTTKSYWFSLCFENDLYPGYVTEKVLEAWLGWSIPLYWGDDAAGILNPKAIVNLANFQTMKHFVDYVEVLYRDKERLIEMLNEPLLVKNFEFHDLVNFINKGLIKKQAV